MGFGHLGSRGAGGARRGLDPPELAQELLDPVVDEPAVERRHVGPRPFQVKVRTSVSAEPSPARRTADVEA